MQSRYFENVVAEVLNLTGQYSDLALRRCLQHSHMLSSDVSAAFDPNYASAFERKYRLPGKRYGIATNILVPEENPVLTMPAQNISANCGK